MRMSQRISEQVTPSYGLRRYKDTDYYAIMELSAAAFPLTQCSLCPCLYNMLVRPWRLVANLNNSMWNLFSLIPDINECLNPDTCPNEQCENTPGSYECIPCLPGHEARNGICYGEYNPAVQRNVSLIYFLKILAITPLISVGLLKICFCTKTFCFNLCTITVTLHHCDVASFNLSRTFLQTLTSVRSPASVLMAAVRTSLVLTAASATRASSHLQTAKAAVVSPANLSLTWHHID